MLVELTEKEARNVVTARYFRRRWRSMLVVWIVCFGAMLGLVVVLDDAVSIPLWLRMVVRVIPMLAGMGYWARHVLRADKEAKEFVKTMKAGISNAV